jgi:hypothetical protein
VDPNDHPAVFAQYAHSVGWVADHLGWFVQTTIFIAGLLVLLYALNLPDGLPRLMGGLCVVAAGVALSLSAVRYLVDGIVLKRAVDAWVGAPDPDKAARFASAETARWLEEASASYQGFMLGLTLILLAVLVVWSARVPRSIGYLLALGGVGYLAVGWILGEAGFAPQGALPTYIGQLALLIAGVWLLITAWRMPAPAELADMAP